MDDNEDFSTSVDASAYGSRHKALEVVLKEKTKHFLSFVKMDKVLTPSPSRRRLGRSGSRKIKEKASPDFDHNSRRTSVSSMASLEPPTPISEAMPVGRGSLSSNRSIAEPGPGFAPLRRPSDASWVSTSPNQPMIKRRFSVLKRTVSSRSSNNDGKSGDSHEPQMEDIDETVDNREGVYDTSKKQRVPSWVGIFQLPSDEKSSLCSVIECFGSRSSFLMKSHDHLHLHRTMPIKTRGIVLSAVSRTLFLISADICVSQ